MKTVSLGGEAIPNANPVTYAQKVEKVAST